MKSMNSCTAEQLLCQLQSNPIGIGTGMPEFSWQFTQSGQDCRQTGYRILAASTPELLQDSRADLWDSGEIISDQNGTLWSGAPLTDLTKCWWAVRLRDAQEQWGPWSKPAYFLTGIINPEVWKAEWIGGYPLLRHEFSLNKKIDRAIAFSSGAGMYELRINGQKAGINLLTPTHTGFSHRIEYWAQDVTDLLHEGQNAIGFMLASGWYQLKTAFPGNQQPLLGTLQLELLYSDGGRCRIVTDQEWMASAKSPVVESSLYNGEIYDARLDPTGWDLPDFDDSGWEPVQTFDQLTIVPTAPVAPPICAVQSIRPEAIRQVREGIQVVDFGQNFSGYVQINIKNPYPGQKITLRYSELLYPDGQVNQENMRQALSRDIYICKGIAEELWTPRFTYHGFRYVEVEGWVGRLTDHDITGRWVRTSVQRTGTFSCSEPFLNRIYEAMVWTLGNNLHDKPTDCCQRDERQGWLGDGQIAMEGVLYSYGAQSLYRKWLYDMSDIQDPDTGALTSTCAPRWPRQESMPWNCAYFVVAWNLLRYYGDVQTIEQHFDKLCRFFDYLHDQSENSLLLHYGHPYGDWLRIEYTEPVQIDNAFWYLIHVIMSDLSAALNKPTQSRLFADRGEAVRQAYQTRWYYPGTGYYNTCDRLSQLGQALPIALGIPDLAEESKIVSRLLENVCTLRGETVLTGGIIGTKYICEALEKVQRWDLVCDVLMRRNYPSWGFMLEHGATTIWERWEYMIGNEMNSHNHPVLCAPVGFFHRVLAGLAWPFVKKGIRTFIIHPRFPAILEYARGSLQTPWGDALSEWSRDGKQIRLHIVIPAGTCAEIIASAPDGSRQPALIQLDQKCSEQIMVGSGDYQLTIIQKPDA